MGRLTGDVGGKRRRGLASNDNESSISDWVLLLVEGLFTRRPWVRICLAAALLFAPVCLIGYVFLR